MLADTSPIFAVAVALLPLARGLGVAPAPQLAALRHAPLPLLQVGQAVLRRALARRRWRGRAGAGPRRARPGLGRVEV